MAPGANVTPTSLSTRDPDDGLAHDNLGPQFNVAIWVLTGAAAVFLALRLYCKFIRRKKLWWDDWVLLASFVFLIAQTSLLSVCVHLGFGTHSWDIKDWPSYLFVSNVTGVCSIIAAAWSKTSFAILLLRFTDGWTRRLVWTVIVTVNLFLGLSALFTYVQCRPIARLWDSTVPGSCWPSKVIVTYNSFSSAYSGAMDILLATIPWWIINRRSLNKKERLGVLVAMSMGVFAGLTSIAKTATLSGISNPDTIATVSLMILATAETAITIIAASIPVLRTLIHTTPHTPHFYHYYHSQNTEPSQTTSDRGLIAPPSPVLTQGRKDSLFSSQLGSPLSQPGSSPATSPGKIEQGATASSWLNSGSESGLELPTREGPGGRVRTYHSADIR